jgi:hypothetical protein
MAQQTVKMQDDVEQLRRRFDEFRNTEPLRSRLPEPLWAAAAELATRYGVHATARALRLDYSGLKRRVEQRSQPKSTPVEATTFVELIGPVAGNLTSCSVEVESAQGGKLRLELKAVATSELVNLIRAFIGH